MSLWSAQDLQNNFLKGRSSRKMLSFIKEFLRTGNREGGILTTGGICTSGPLLPIVAACLVG